MVAIGAVREAMQGRSIPDVQPSAVSARDWEMFRAHVERRVSQGDLATYYRVSKLEVRLALLNTLHVVLDGGKHDTA